MFKSTKLPFVQQRENAVRGTVVICEMKLVGLCVNHSCRNGVISVPEWFLCSCIKFQIVLCAIKCTCK